MGYATFERSRFNFDFNYWLIDDVETMRIEGSQTTFELNLHYNLILVNRNNFALYGVGALGYHYDKKTIEGVEVVEDEEIEHVMGLGVGAGIEYNFGKVSLFAEPQIFFSGVDQFKTNFGARIYF